MIEYKIVDRDTFLNEVSNIEYREDDIREANEFGCLDIHNCYMKAQKHFSRYFIVYEDMRPICSIMLQRDGNIIFFISKNVKHKIKLIKVLRKLANKIVNCCGPIITKTASWYDEALRLNKIIGFMPYKLFNEFGLYVLEK